MIDDEMLCSAIPSGAERESIKHHGQGKEDAQPTTRPDQLDRLREAASGRHIGCGKD